MKRIAVSVLALALSAAAGSAVANHQDYGNGNGYDNGNYPSNSSRSDYAQVTRVEPIYSNSGSSYQRQECWNEQTSSYDNGYYRDGSGRLYQGDGRNNTGRVALGALIGGALGNQVGRGDGKKAATIGGAVIGGLIANNTGRNNDSYDQYRDNSGTVRRCRTVNDNGNNYNNDGYGNNQGGNGYKVTYRYAGQTYQAVTNYRPGRTIRVVVDVRPQDDNVNYRR